MLERMIEETLMKAIEANTVNFLTLFMLLKNKGLITDAEFLVAHARAELMVNEEFERITKGASNDDRNNQNQTSE